MPTFANVGMGKERIFKKGNLYTVNINLPAQRNNIYILYYIVLHKPNFTPIAAYLILSHPSDDDR